jgi:hypothetical protein
MALDLLSQMVRGRLQWPFDQLQADVRLQSMMEMALDE